LDSKGFAYVEMFDENSFNIGLSLNKTLIGNNIIKIKKSKSKDDLNNEKLNSTEKRNISDESFKVKKKKKLSNTEHIERNDNNFEELSNDDFKKFLF
jgi:hypothetical protein